MMDEWTIDPGAEPGAAAKLSELLNQRFEGLTLDGGEGPWERLPDGRIRCRLTIEAGRNDFCSKAGNALAEFMVCEWEPGLIRRLLQRRYGLLPDSVETDVLISETIGLMDGEPDPEEETFSSVRGRERRIRRWGQSFADYLMENGLLQLEGFIRFRLGEYRSEMQEAAETAAEERLMERQYEEFVSLLQSMVQWQEVRIPAVHVLHGGGHAFRLLDDKMRPLEKESAPPEEASPLPEDPDAQAEEESLLVSRLLAASPRHLYIHTAEPDAQVIRTLMGIFGDRAALCPDQPLRS